MNLLSRAVPSTAPSKAWIIIKLVIGLYDIVYVYLKCRCATWVLVE